VATSVPYGNGGQLTFMTSGSFVGHVKQTSIVCLSSASRSKKSYDVTEAIDCK